MGSYSSLSVGNVVIDTIKSTLPIGSLLFCYEDKQKKYRVEYEDTEYVLTRKLNSILPRLELEGYTLKNSKKILLSCLSESEKKITYDDLERELSSINFANNKYSCIDQLIFKNSFNVYLEPLALLRILIELLKDKDIDISLDYMELYNGGYITKKFLSNPSNKFLILTEGKIDTEILNHSLKKLFPYIYSYFTFANMEESPFGGTTNLVKFIKGLNSIKYKENVIAVFDNDTAGNSAILEIPKKINSNIKTIHLPKHKKFSKFNTIGVSNKIVKKNINGTGVAIECFLDLPEDSFIRWISYDEKLKQYQGCFDARFKKEYYRNFISSINDPDGNYDYGMLTFLWNKIISVAIKMSEKTLLEQYKQPIF